MDIPPLADDEVAIVTLPSGRKLVVAKVNQMGGVCDDCRDDAGDEMLTEDFKFEVRKLNLG